MTIAVKINKIMSTSSWIRKMFEEGARLKAEHGAENVFDFSLGNPNVPQPEKFKTALQSMAASSKPGDHGYMPNPGYPDVRKAVAQHISKELEAQLSANEVIMTCGAAGGLNVILKTILNPGETVITPTPHFVEYGYYADNHGGSLVTVPTKPDFSLDIDRMASAITSNTRAVLINSPNNPTGRVYTRQSLEALGTLLTEKSKTFDRTIYLISDEPYRKIVYGDIEVPGIFPCYRESIVTTSYSKDISIPGERLGYIAVNPAATYKNDLLAGMALANRILGFVNAPAFMQRVIAGIQGEVADMSAYAKKMSLLCDGLSECGYEFSKPDGAFYLFPKSPIEDDVAFVQALQEELILTVPGSGFGGPGYFRIAFCVDDNTIKNAMPGFKRVMEKIKG